MGRDYLSKNSYLLALICMVVFGCLPDRLPPDPTEIDRPIFVRFSPEDSAAFSLPLRDSILMMFNEPMDISTFPDNFILASVTNSIDGSFKAEDTVVIFLPIEDMEAAAIYMASVTGGVKDVFGNSMSIDSTEEAFSHSMWLFTEGDYSEDGFHRIYVSDKIDKGKVYVVGNFNELISELYSLAEASDDMTVTPDGSKLLIVNKLVEGYVSVIDVLTNEKVDSISVGSGPTDIRATNETAFVVNRSGKTVSVIDLNSLTVSNTIEFADGFTPRNIAIQSDYSRIYLTGNSSADKGKVKVINTGTLVEIATIDDVLLARKSAAIAVSGNGNYVFVLEDRTNYVGVIETTSQTVLDPIQLPVTQNKDIVTYGDFIFVSTSGGFIYKIDANSQSITDSTEVPLGTGSLDVTSAGEVLYVSSPNDSTVQIIETNTMQLIRSPKINGSLKNIAISSLKF